ncbi:MAG: hypothetical protein CO042_03850, partial [Parcubacteria group bacterium CG_4_9_14_0_2_um_filter_41_8]
MGGLCRKNKFFPPIMFALFACAFFAGIFLFAPFAAASEITVLGSSGAPWPPVGSVLRAENGPYLIDSTLTVETYQNITFEPGVIIKMASGAQLLVRGTLNVSGTEDNPVVFTSDKDDEYGGDTNNDGSASYPLFAGSWNRIGVYGTLDMDYVVIRYGGSRGSNGGMIELYKSSHTEIADSIIEFAGQGIRMEGQVAYPSDLIVSDSIFRYNTIGGMRISGASSASVSGSVFSGNAKGVWVHDIMSGDDFSFSDNSFISNSVSGFAFNGVCYGAWALIDLRGSWWGSSLGPVHADNPTGDGDSILADSGDVLFSPWLGADPALPQNIAPVLSFIDDEGYVDDGVEPNVSFMNQDVPIFQVAFSDADGDSAEFVRLVVGDDMYFMSTSASSTFEFVPPGGMFAKGAYEYYFEASDGVSSVRLPVDGELSFEVRLVPVVLVPGIMGTELWKGEDLIWPDIQRMIFWFLDDFLDPL